MMKPKTAQPHEAIPGMQPCTYWNITPNEITPVSGGIVHEARLALYVNGQELATLMSSPLDQDMLALGFLFNEGIIQTREEVRLMKLNARSTGIDIILNRSQFDPPRRMVLTSGCGGGVSFQDLQAVYPALDTPFTIDPAVLLALMRTLKSEAQLYNRVRGVHTAVLGDATGRLLLSAEDVGRHNTIDKIAGKALDQAVQTRDRILVTSGRISSEMLNKARVMGVPVVASHTSPTSLTVQLADAWQICVVGYVRQGSMRVYTHPRRVGLPETLLANE
jgi:FdhD protein